MDQTKELLVQCLVSVLIGLHLGKGICIINETRQECNVHIR